MPQLKSKLSNLLSKKSNLYKDMKKIKPVIADDAARSSQLCLTVSIHVRLAEEPPPAGAPAGVHHGPQELPTAELDCLHLRPHLLHLHHCQQQQRQNHQKVHAGGPTVCTEL